MAPRPINQRTFPPFNRHRLRLLAQRNREIRAIRKARMAECERLLRQHQTPSENLFHAWLGDCEVELIDPEERYQWLTRPVQQRLTDLLADHPKGWPSPDQPPPTDRLLCRRLENWGALTKDQCSPLVYELVTYLEDVQTEAAQRLAARSAWQRAEAERADAIVDALSAILDETVQYVKELSGEPHVDPRIGHALPSLLSAQRWLRTTDAPLTPRADRPGRRRIGSDKGWATQVVAEVHARLLRIRPWRKYEDDAEAVHKKSLGDLAEKIVTRLGIRGARGIGSAKPERSRPPANPRPELARRLRAALGVKSLRSPHISR